MNFNSRMDSLTRGCLIAFTVFACMGSTCLAQIGGTAGAFTRLGFGARGQGMGNALTAVPEGVISAYYNPALTPFQTGHVLYGNYSFLSLDRKLNEISYTQNIELHRKNARGETGDEVLSVAGVSAGWINAGDADIDGYDSDGFPTGKLSVFENQFFLNFGNRFSRNFAAGFNVKFYYAGLYSGVTSSGFGIDVGFLYSVSERVHVALVLQELLTKYKWDTSNLYGQQMGNATENPFARIVRLAVSAPTPGIDGIIDAETEMYDGKTFLGRIGAEVSPVEQVQIRAGVERIDFSGDGIAARPCFGVGFTQTLAQWTPIISYAFILEPVAPSPSHVLSFALSF